MDAPPLPPDPERAFATHQWGNGLFGCFNNASLCVLGWILPCVLFGQTSDLLQGKSCVVYGSLWLVPLVSTILQADQREVVRRIRGIPGSGVSDFCLSMWCPCCSLIQQSQEVESLNRDGYTFPVQMDYPAVSTISRDMPSDGDPYGPTTLPDHQQAGYQATDFSPPTMDTGEAENRHDVSYDRTRAEAKPDQVVVQQQPNTDAVY